MLTAFLCITFGILIGRAYKGTSQGLWESAKIHRALPPGPAIESRLRRLGCRILGTYDLASVADIGAVRIYGSKEPCQYCDTKSVRSFQEIVAVTSADGLLISSRNELGDLCLSCGNLIRSNECEKVGYFGQRIPKRGNLKDLIVGLETNTSLPAIEALDHAMGEHEQLLLKAVGAIQARRSELFKGGSNRLPLRLVASAAERESNNAG